MFRLPISVCKAVFERITGTESRAGTSPTGENQLLALASSTQMQSAQVSGKAWEFPTPQTDQLI